MAFVKPVMTADPEYVVDEATGETAHMIEHYAQGDYGYRVIHNFKTTPEPTPYRVFSKLSLEAKLFEEGLLEAVDAFIDSQTITNSHGQTMPLRRMYDTALEFSEEHPRFGLVVDAIKQALGLSDDKAEEILSAGVKDTVYPSVVVEPEDEEQRAYRTFSKLLLEEKLFEEGVLGAVDSFIDSQIITNERGQTMPLRRKYETALDFNEAHPLFRPAVSAIQNLLGWTDEKAEEVLASSVKEYF